MTPRELINPNYTNDDIWVQENSDLILRPETTPGSYAYARHLLQNHSASYARPPFVVWQSGKSFRREQDQVTKNMRLKEFYQQEFQCFFTDDSMNDYHSTMLSPVRKMISDALGVEARIVESDRLPDYSLKTMDIEVQSDGNWMEVCSISLRKDFTDKVRFSTKKKSVEKSLLVLEIAIGLDRCVYNFNRRISL